MFNVNTKNREITMSAGDTGEITFRISGFDFSDVNYRVVFAVKNHGKILKEEYYQVDDDGRFVVNFVNEDTDKLDATVCKYDVTVVVEPVWSGGRIVDGGFVRTLIPPTRVLVRPAVREI